MSISKLFDSLKGGPKSGNYGHSGRIGKRGGSVSRTSFVLNGQSTTLKKAGTVIPEELPQPREGHIRLYTTLNNTKDLESVEQKGLLTDYAKQLEYSGNIIWATSGPEDYSSGRALVAFDVPKEQAQKVNSTDYTIGYDIPSDKIVATYPMVTWSKHSGDVPLRWDKVLTTVNSYGKDRILANDSIADSVKDLIR